MKYFVVGALLSLGVVGCGGSPSTPTPPPPTYVNAAGLWTGSLNLTSVTGGECAGTAYQSFLGTPRASLALTLQVTQDVSALTAVATATATGVATNYTGTAGTTSFTLNIASAGTGTISGFTCLDGQSRDLKLTAATIVANVNGNAATGTFTDTYNVFVAGTQTNVGTMVLGGTATLAR
jgi:hypothetical protein